MHPFIQYSRLAGTRRSWLAGVQRPPVWHTRLVFILLFFPTAFAQAQLTIQPGAIFKTTGNVLITLQDLDLINNGGINQSAGDGRFIFTGSGNNTISGSSNSIFDQLEIAKTGTARLYLSQSISIGSGVYFTSGLIDLNNQTLLLQPTSMLNGENATSRIMSDNGGYVEISSLLNAPVAVDPGNLGAIISSSKDPGNTIVRRGHTAQTNVGSAGTSILRYYDIIPSNNVALNATLRIDYSDAELNGLNGNTLVLWKSTDTVHWTNEGYSSRDASADYVEQTGIADFSRWTLSSGSNPLPVIFLSFTGKCMSGSTLLDWATAQEQNSSRFDVQRSADGSQWQAISSIAAAGNSQTEKNYSYTDPAPFASQSFYRIAEYDLDGMEKFTGTVSLHCGMIYDDVTIYPNPVRSLLLVSLTTAGTTEVKTEIYDSKGALVHTQMNSATSGNNQFSMNMTGLLPGLYLLKIQWDNGKKEKIMKVIKE